MLSPIRVASLSCLSLALTVHAQDVHKVAAPLPPVDLDLKVWTPAAAAPTTTPKTENRTATPPHQPGAAPVKSAAEVVLPGGKSFAPRMPTDHAVFGGDGQPEIQVLGSTYKASVTDTQFTYVPYLGADAPQNYPLRLSLDTVQLGATTQPLARATLRREGARVTIHRGAVEERYDVGLDRVEQKFVVTTPFTGDLTITVRVDTELQASRDGAGLRFGNVLGSVGYTNAVLVDATGRRFAMRTELNAGSLALRAAATTIASATFPITVDPVLTTYAAATSTAFVLSNPDISYSQQSQQYLVVWTRTFSASDTDLHAVAVDTAGNVVAGSFTLLDNTSNRWDTGRVAVCGSNFLAVASRLPQGGGQREIWGVTRDVSSPTLGAQFQISTGAGDKVAPDVGGEFDGPTNFCVVWQRNFSATDHDIHYRMVTAGGALNGASNIVDNSGADDFEPSIAKCDGRLPSPQQVWPIAWQRLVGGQHDIWGARMSWNGIVVTPSFAIDSSATDNDVQPCVTSPTDEMAGARFWMVTYTTNSTGDFDVYLRVYRDGTTPVLDSARFLATLENLSAALRTRNQSRAQADSDGCRFAISYVEEYTSTDHDVYLTTLHLAPSPAVIESRVALTASTLDSLFGCIVAARSGGGSSIDYGTAWDSNSASGPVNSSISGALYSGATAGGGFNTRATACGGVSLSFANGSQIPAPGRTIQFDVSGGGPSLIVVGTPSSIPLCAPAPCTLGATLMVVIPGPTLTLSIPCQANLVGATIAVQGAAVGVVGGCNAFGQLGTSNTVDVTVR